MRKKLILMFQWCYAIFSLSAPVVIAVLLSFHPSFHWTLPKASIFGLLALAGLLAGSVMIVQIREKKPLH